MGAVHIAAPLASMATTAGFDVHVVDPRSVWATEERFPGVHLVGRGPTKRWRSFAPIIVRRW